LKFLSRLGPKPVLPPLLPGLENTNARAYTKRLIVQMVDLYHQHHHMNLLPDIVSLFEPAAARPEARRALREVLTYELAHISLPALINGLQEQSLMGDCVDSLLMTLVNFPD